MATSEHPLILTLALDATSAAFFNELRQQHFPPERNYLDSHLTLFHQLPAAEIDSITATLEEISQQYHSLHTQVSEVRLLGRGVAYRIESRLLQQLHRQLQKKWQPYLTAQDQQRLWPHVTVQNKVDASVAQALHEQLSADFEPFEAVGEGLRLWEYHGGPWRLQQSFAFKQQSSGTAQATKSIS